MIAYDEPLLEMQRRLDYIDAQHRFIESLPDEVLEHIAWLGCHDDVVRAAYSALARRRSA